MNFSFACCLLGVGVGCLDEISIFLLFLFSAASGIFAYDVSQFNNLANQTVRIAAMTFATTTSILFNLNTDRSMSRTSCLLFVFVDSTHRIILAIAIVATVNSFLGSLNVAGGVRNEGFVSDIDFWLCCSLQLASTPP
jgi:hypothetical protein